MPVSALANRIDRQSSQQPDLTEFLEGHGKQMPAGGADLHKYQSAAMMMHEKFPGMVCRDCTVTSEARATGGSCSSQEKDTEHGHGQLP